MIFMGPITEVRPKTIFASILQAFTISILSPLPLIRKEFSLSTALLRLGDVLPQLEILNLFIVLTYWYIVQNFAVFKVLLCVLYHRDVNDAIANWRL